MCVNWLNGIWSVNNLKYLCGITDLINEYENLYDELFEPRRIEIAGDNLMFVNWLNGLWPVNILK